MKNIKRRLWVCSILMISLLFSACSRPSPEAVTAPASTPGAVTARQETPPPASEPQGSFSSSAPSSPAASPSATPFTIEDIAPYSGQPYVAVNDNVPFFSEDEFTSQSFAAYSELDELGRCGAACASIGIDLMPAKERDSIGYIKPSGWHTVKYNDIIDGNYLYNRCHLIGYQLCGNNDEKNLFTGTRYLNVQGMQPFENMVAGYVSRTENHVLYRVTPIFEGDNLVASGVLMEASSVEDNGGNIQFCVYVYNVQPGIIIDLATGESSLAPTPQPAVASTPQPATTPTETPPASQEQSPQSMTYILNINTDVFHYPDCESVKQMKDKNKREYTGARDEIISMGYRPCQNCHP